MDSQNGRIHMCMPELLFEDVGTCPRSKGADPGQSQSGVIRISGTHNLTGSLMLCLR